jgi:hypothetical protein
MEKISYYIAMAIPDWIAQRLPRVLKHWVYRSRGGILLSLIRKVMPQIIAADICGVQPMLEPVGKIFSLNPIYEADRHPDVFGDIVHDFLRGWMFHDGEKFVPLHEYIDKYGYEPMDRVDYYAAVRLGEV